MVPDNKVYLGDGVYGDVTDCGGLILTTDTNRIVLEPEVIARMEEWFDFLRERATLRWTWWITSIRTNNGDTPPFRR